MKKLHYLTIIIFVVSCGPVDTINHRPVIIESEPTIPPGGIISTHCNGPSLVFSPSITIQEYDVDQNTHISWFVDYVVDTLSSNSRPFFEEILDSDSEIRKSKSVTIPVSLLPVSQISGVHIVEVDASEEATTSSGERPYRTFEDENLHDSYYWVIDIADDGTCP